MLKHPLWLQTANGGAQPPSGGCVLKQFVQPVFKLLKAQPPSGGCVLKLTMGGQPQQNLMPAAFGRLCVETAPEPAPGKQPRQPPSGGCVLKPLALRRAVKAGNQPPSGGCVLKP